MFLEDEKKTLKIVEGCFLPSVLFCVLSAEGKRKGVIMTTSRLRRMLRQNSTEQILFSFHFTHNCFPIVPVKINDKNKFLKTSRN